jgi:hypothetical protein
MWSWFSSLCETVTVRIKITIKQQKNEEPGPRYALRL